MNQSQVGRTNLSLRGSFKSLEADIHHANSLADAVQQEYGGAGIQLRVSQNQWAPVFLYLMKLVDCGCLFTLPSYFTFFHILICKVYVEGESSVSFERRATVREFYGIIYPYLQQLEGGLCEKETAKEKGRSKEIMVRSRGDESKKVVLEKDWEIEDECDICMEVCTKMVLPDCSHEICINCYRDWYRKSKSCPFCRGNLKRVRSRDLWVLTSDSDVIDKVTLDKENVDRFYSYIDSLPLVVPDNLFVFYYDYYLV